MASRKFGRPSEVNISSRDLERGIPEKSRQKFGKSRELTRAENEKRERIKRILTDPSYKSAVNSLNKQGAELSRLEAIKRDAENRKRRLEQSDARPSTYFREYQELNTTITATDRLINTIRRKQASEQQVKQAIANALVSGDKATARELAQRLQSSYISSQDSNQYISGEVSSAARRSKDRSQTIEQQDAGGYVDYRVAQQQARELQKQYPGETFQSTIDEGGQPIFKSEPRSVMVDDSLGFSSIYNEPPVLSVEPYKTTEKILDVKLSDRKQNILGGLFKIPQVDFKFSLQPLREYGRSEGFISPLGTNEGKRLIGEFATPIIGVAEGSVNLAIDTERSFKSLAIAGGIVGGKIITGKGFPEIGQKLATDPKGSVARGLGEITSYVAPQYLIVKGIPQLAALGTRLEPKYRSVKTVPYGTTGLNEQIIKGIPVIGDLGLIPPGKIKTGGLPKGELPPTIRGGFGYKASEQAKFKGQVGVATSQRGLLKLFKKETKLIETEPGLGLFGTPRDPKTGRLITRVSRLGESPRLARFRDIVEGNFGFGPTAKPQIIVFQKEKVGRKGGFEITTLKDVGGKRTSELEVITKAPNLGGPTAFKKTGTPAVTVLGPKGKPGLFGGRRVPIVTAEFTPTSPGVTKLFGKLERGQKLTRGEELRLYQKTGFRSSDLTKSTPRISPTGLLTTALPRTKSTLGITRTSKFSGSIRVERTSRTTPRITRTTPITRIGTPPLRPPTTPPGSPPTIPPNRPPTTPPIRPPPPPTGGPPPPTAKGFSSDKAVKGSQDQPGFLTFIIRGGKEVKLPGIRPRGLALKKGATETRQTLAATFGIRRAGTVRQRDISFYPSQKEFRTYRIKQGRKVPTNVFIQRTTPEGGLRGGRLSTKSERRALQLARI